MDKETKIGVAIVAGALVAFALLIGVMCVRANARVHREDLTPVAVTVRAGDTAWSIAERYCPAGVDRREYLGWCAEANGLGGMGDLKAGHTYVFLQAKED